MMLGIVMLLLILFLPTGLWSLVAKAGACVSSRAARANPRTAMFQ